jgi:hypothetical protein
LNTAVFLAVFLSSSEPINEFCAIKLFLSALLV